MSTHPNLPAPLQGLHVVEFEGIGPGPLAGRILADMGASITLITRPSGTEGSATSKTTPLRAGKTTLPLDLKNSLDVGRALDCLATADALIEGNRPGVMERLGLGPEDCAKRNPRLVYGRMTGWGQHGPLSLAAGHDLNYVALTGLLSTSARRGQLPMLPPTVLGDGSGALGLAFGIACALLDVQRGGPGRVVDAAIVDVVSMLGHLAHWLRGQGRLDGPEPSPFHDSPFYDVYECADGKYVSICALEPQFYALLLQKLQLQDVLPQNQQDRSLWPALKQRLAAVFASRTRLEWCDLLEGTDVCFAPVLTMAESARHPHMAQRGIYRSEPTGGLTPAVAPRFLPLVREG